ncbi:MAG TPA: FtsQ-type POTRA domain-containing protein, partial [Chitinophagaceae bacterium]|nr:FtsQ-type POTRA domain-containing protein [Chitinophagaceae bacterium]
IKGAGDDLYLDKDDIIQAIQKASHTSIIREQLKNINLDKLEASLEKNAWIQDAQLYFDSRDELHISVTERQPLARVFTTAGNSFYIDKTGLRMPVQQGNPFRVPVITNFPAAKKLRPTDSALLSQATKLAIYIHSNDFWRAQVAQLDIVDGKIFEIIPTVGRHVIRFGTAENVEQKFSRLLFFYKNVLSKTGLDKYKTLDVQFEDQVVAVHKGAASAIDSIQLEKNIEELLKRSQMKGEDQQPMNIDSLTTNVAGNTNIDMATRAAAIGFASKQDRINVEVARAKTPQFRSIKKVNNANQRQEKFATVRKPKALMTRQVSDD